MQDAPALSLGSISPEEFLTTYWQKKPLLIRGAGAAPSIIDKDWLLEACFDEDADSRLITGDGAEWPWHLTHAPLEPDDIPGDDGQTPWTILLRHAEVRQPSLTALQEALSFIPAWRHQDVMISYASPGGSVGPHVDRYDVFLFQGPGTRNWAIDENARDRSLEWQDHPELHLIKGFQATSNYLCEPGDLLYLPPNVPHWGVARSACLTYSIGFRTPTTSELLLSLATVLSERGNDVPYGDADLSIDEAGTVISPRATARASHLLQSALNSDDLLNQALALWASDPIGEFEPSESDLSADGWQRVPGSRLALSANGTLFADGEPLSPPPGAASLARDIVDDRQWAGQKDGWSKDEQKLLENLAEIGAVFGPDEVD
ncbi:MAG: cupin domain-containing protein [Pseudomonadota bacterium]